MSLLDQANAVLKRHYGYPSFRPGQSNAVEAVLSGRDVLVLMPTGGGKSLCFQIPSQVLPGATIVISPLISLMKDQVDNLAAVGIGATFINSTLPADECERRLASVRSGNVKLLYIAPERLDSPAFQRVLDDLRIAMIAIDEAHCVSQWGHDFRPSYARLYRLRERFDVPMIALTASATPEARADIIAMLRLKDPVLVSKGFDRPNLRWNVIHLKDEVEKDSAFLNELRARRGRGSLIAYAATRKRVEMLADMLNTRGMRAVAYHAGLTPADRHRLQEAFMAGTAGVVVATNAFGMGIDKPDVRLVVHYDYPGSLEAYYQEAGRGGRDGGVAECVVLASPTDHLTHEFLIDQAHPQVEIVKAVYTFLHRSAVNGIVECTARQLVKDVAEVGGIAQADAALRVLERIGAIVRQRGRSTFDRYDPPQRFILAANPPASSEWTKIAAHRRREENRLKEMRAWIHHDGCRRRFVLDYFGDTTPIGECAACDNCLRPRRRLFNWPVRVPH